VPPSNLAINTTTSTLYEYHRPLSIRSWRADVAEALDDAGLSKIATRWLSCSENCYTKLRPVEGAHLPKTAEKVYVCSGDHHHHAEIYSQTCDLRICPECARRHAARLVARYLPTMLELMHSHNDNYRFRHIIFTLPYPLTDPAIRKKYLDGFKQVESVMARLLTGDGPDWKARQGFLVTAEFGEEGGKLHYHVIHYGQYLNQADLSAGWEKATGGAARVVFVRGFPYKGLTIEETLREVLKYAVKFYSEDKATGSIKAIPAQLMPALAACLEKTRRIRSYGVFYGIPEADRQPHTCDQCGAEMVGIPVDYFVTFCNTGFLPLEWRLLTDDQPLHLKPADKSSHTSSGASPPGAGIQALKQSQMAWVERMRKKDDGWGKTK